jgi:arylsulfatase
MIGYPHFVLLHLDGFNQAPFLRGETQKSARNEFFYSDDDGLLVAMRQGDYKWSFAEQRLAGTMGVWAEPFTQLRMNKIYNLMQDPYERADVTSNTYWDWVINHVGAAYGIIEDVGKFAASFKAYPPRSIPPSFSPTTILQETLRDIKAKALIEKVNAEQAPPPPKKKK